MNKIGSYVIDKSGKEKPNLKDEAMKRREKIKDAGKDKENDKAEKKKNLAG